MVNYYIGGAGEGKSYALIEKIKTLSENNEKICIIVPEQYSYEFDKILYRSVGFQKFNSINAFSFTTLSKKIMDKYGDTRINSEYASENKKSIIMSMALDEVYHSPDDRLFYSNQYKKNGFSESMIGIVSELKQAGISPDMLTEKLGNFKGKLLAKMEDISKIYLSYEKIMSDFGFKDHLDDIEESAHIAVRNQYFKDKTVIIDEFESFTGDQYEMLKAIIAHSKDVYIALRTENVNDEEFTLFDIVNRTYRNIDKICRDFGKKSCISKFSSGAGFKYDDLRFLSRNIFRNKKEIYTQTPKNITVFEARDYYSEIEYVCASIKHLVQNIKYNDIAIISNSIEEYSSVLENAFERYNIPAFISIEKGVSHTVTMIYISALLDIISTERYSTESILRYIKTGLSPVDLFEVSAIENFCYKWSIDGKKWIESFIPDDKEDKSEFLECEEIRKKIIYPLEKLKRSIKSDTTADKICRLIYSFIKETEVDVKISNIIDFYTEKNKTYLANEQKKIWDFLMGILDDLYSTLKDRVIPLKQFSVLFKQLLLQAKYSLPPQTLDSVTVAPAQTARLNAPKVVFILGVNEGKFPVSASQSGLFSDDERKLLSEMGLNENKTASNTMLNARLSAYKSLSSAVEKLYVSYPLTNLKGTSEYRSSVIDNMKILFNDNPNLMKYESQIPEHFYAVTEASAYYHLMQNRKNENQSVISIKKVLEQNPVYKEKIDYAYIRSRQDEIYKLSDSEVMQKLINFNNFYISPTGFENYNNCHFQYFCKYCLNLRSREKVEMNVINFGNLLHECLNGLLSKRSKDEFINMTDDELRNEIRTESQQYKAKLFRNDFRQDVRTDFIYEKTVEQILMVVHHLQEEMKNTDFVPEYFETNINKDIGFEPLIVKSKTGKIHFGGIVDRIDTYKSDDGNDYVRIIDYKSSEKKTDRFLLNNGINMQMLLYLFALTQGKGKFSSYIPSGILYSPLTISQPQSSSRDNSLNINHINKSLRFSGLILDEAKIIGAMDKSSKNDYIKIKAPKNSVPPVETLSSEQIEMLREFSKNKMKSMNDSLFEGDIEVNPLINKKYHLSPCDYCDFIDICGNFPICRYHDGNDIDTSEIDQIFENNCEEDE